MRMGCLPIPPQNGHIKSRPLPTMLSVHQFHSSRQRDQTPSVPRTASNLRSRNYENSGHNDKGATPTQCGNGLAEEVVSRGNVEDVSEGRRRQNKTQVSPRKRCSVQKEEGRQ